MQAIPSCRAVSAVRSAALNYLLCLFYSLWGENDRLDLSLALEKDHSMLFFQENIVLDDIIQNLLNLKVNYPMRFLPLSLLISDYTLRLLKKLVKR
jgi:hypothetical protein